MRSPVYILALVLICVSFSTRETNAQVASISDRFFIETGIGGVMYMGDRGLQGLSGMEWLVESTGPGFDFGIGYQWRESIDLVGKWATGIFPGIDANKTNLKWIDSATSDDSKTQFRLEARYRLLPFGKYEPSISAGFGFAFGSLNGETKTGAGPILGIGFSRPLGPVTVYSQIDQLLVYPNSALDAAGSGKSPDALSNFSFGVRYHFRSQIPSLGTVSMVGPGFLKTDEDGVFTVTTNLDPVDYTVLWQFGDGSSASGYSVRHAFAQPAEYEVHATVSNSRESFEVQTRVAVEIRLEPISITAMTQVPMSPVTGEVVEYRPIIRGNHVVCNWSFGDGSYSDTCETSHVFSDPGSYEITLEASNEEYSDSATRSTSVETDVCSVFPDLTSVYFARHSSDLSLDMRQVLRDNFSAAATCPDRMLEIDGFAFLDERDAFKLAEARAQAVRQYYLNLGMNSYSVELGSTSVQNMDQYDDLAWTGRKVTTAMRKR